MKKDKDKKQIACCPDCGTPVIWTFIIGGSEYFCMKCKWSGGMLYANTKDWTKEAQETYDKNLKEFKEARKGFVPIGSTMEGCEKCERQKERNDKYHIWHLTEEELKAHNEAKERIFKK